MKRAREEGFEIPHGPTEAEAFLRLRRFLERRALLPAKGNGRRRRSRASEARV